MSLHETVKRITKSRHAWGMERGADVTGYLMQFYTQWLKKQKTVDVLQQDWAWVTFRGFNRNEYIHNPCASTHMHSEKNCWQEMKKKNPVVSNEKHSACGYISTKKYVYREIHHRCTLVWNEQLSMEWCGLNSSLFGLEAKLVWLWRKKMC